MAMLKISFKPKLAKGAVFSLPTAAQIGHEDEGRHCLLSSLLAADVRKPRATVSFDPEAMTFSFQLELSNCRSASGVVPVNPMAMDDGYFPCFDYLAGLLARESCCSLLFKF